MTARARSLFVLADSLDGGIGAAVLSHCTAFAAHDWHVVLAAPSATQHPAEGVTAVDVDVPDAAAHVRPMLGVAGQVRRLLAEEVPDVVHAHGLRSLGIMLIAGRRPFVTLHSSDRSPGWVSPSTWLKEKFRDVTPSVVPGAFSVVPLSRGRWTPVLLPSPRLPDLEALPGQPPADDPLFVFPARLAPPKRPDVFVDAMAQLADRVPGARGVLLGEGPDRGAIEQRIGAKGAPVELAGRVDDMTDWYRRAWAVCLFSDSEGLPFVVQESMWAGRPVVTSDLRGISWFAGQAGLYADDAAAARDVLLELCEPAYRQQRGAAARRRAEAMLGEDRVYQTLSAAYERRDPASAAAAGS